MKNAKQKFLSVLFALFVTVSLFALTGCTKTESEQTNPTSTEVQTNDDLSEQIGEGSHTFLFTVENEDGSHTNFTVSTDETIVGSALLQLGLIDGEQGQYGLYVKTVNGVTADYETDGAYWSFYADGEMALTGVDGTQIEDGHSYAFVWTKA